MAQAGG
ncbi:hypothetical protein YPPY88_1126, partial [Yersinia pestis PY-88]